MEEIFGMKLHETLTPSTEQDLKIIRVPGGWIYRFSQINQLVQSDGTWSENYFCDSVFVPLSQDCGSEESAVEHEQAKKCPVFKQCRYKELPDCNDQCRHKPPVG